MSSVQKVSYSATWSTTRSVPVESLLVIGTGSIGFRHLINATVLGVPELAVFSTGIGVGNGVVPDGVRVETDLEQALARGVRAVIIANPTSLHIESALPAARTGCHLLIEKPLSHTLAGIEELHRQIGTQQVAMVGYQFRFHPSLQQIRSWLEERAIGEVVSARAV